MHPKINPIPLAQYQAFAYTSEKPANYGQLERLARLRVQARLLYTNFDSDNSEHVQAVKDAVCSQIQYWEGNQVNPEKIQDQPTIKSSMSVQGASISYADASTINRAKVQAATDKGLCDSAMLYLGIAGIRVMKPTVIG